MNTGLKTSGVEKGVVSFSVCPPLLVDSSNYSNCLNKVRWQIYMKKTLSSFLDDQKKSSRDPAGACCQSLYEPVNCKIECGKGYISINRFCSLFFNVGLDIVVPCKLYGEQSQFNTKGSKSFQVTYQSGSNVC